jgi:hypothetical protein
MRRAVSLTFAVAALVVAGLAIAHPAAAATTSFVAGVTGANEVPATASGGSGVVNITIDDVSLQVCIDASGVTGLSGPITADHIHTGAAGVEGGVVVNFNGLAVTCVTSDATTVANILANPTGFYVNLHTAANPGGEVRGQLGTSLVRTLTAVTSGANVVPPSQSAGGGPVTVTIDTGSNKVCLDASGVTGLTGPTESNRIGQGAAGANGPDVVDFGAATVVCVISTPAITSSILGNASGFYVVLDTDEFSNGEVRGQLALVPLPPATTTTTSTSTSTTSTTTTSTTTTTVTPTATPASPVAVSPRLAG